VFSCIGAKATAATDPRLIVQQRSGTGEWAEVSGHPLRRLLMRPNPYMDEASFLRAAIVSWDVARVFYAEIVRSGTSGRGPIAELWPLNPASMTPRRVNGEVIGYVWREGRDTVEYGLKDLLIRHPAGWHDPAPLAVALGAVDADSAMTDFVRAFFNNGGVPSGILTIKGRTLTQLQSDDIRDKWRSKFSRRTGVQQDIAVLDDNAEYQQTGANLDQLESDKVRGVSEARICMVFGVPPQVVGAYVGLMHATYSNYQQAQQAFWDNTLTPMFKDWQSWLTWHLLNEFASEELIYSERVRLHWDMSAVAALQDDVDATQERGRANLLAGALTLNEFRGIIGEQPDQSGGNYYLRPAAMVAVPANTAPAPPMLEQAGRALLPQLKALQSTSTARIERRIKHAVEVYLLEEYEKAASAVLEG